MKRILVLAVAVVLTLIVTFLFIYYGAKEAETYKMKIQQERRER